MRSVPLENLALSKRRRADLFNSVLFVADFVRKPANGYNGIAGSVTLDRQGNVTGGEFDSADPSTVISASILPTGSVDIAGNPSVSGYTLDQFGHGILTMEFN